MVSMTLSRDRFTVSLDPTREQSSIGTEYKVIPINFECEDTEFQDLYEIRQRIVEGHEDKLSFIGL